MTKVIIVDDDLFLRSNLKMMINWESNGFILCGEASNGEEALQLIEKSSPNIILSDVKMPVMDGIKLTSIIKETHPEIQLIILSNYDDFEYVRSSMKNGALDYILKHSLNENILLDCLYKARIMINKGEHFTTSKSMLENISVLKEKFIIELLGGFYTNEEEIQNHINILDINLDVKNTVSIVMVIDDYKRVALNQNLKAYSITEYAILNIVDEILKDHSNGAIIHISNEKFAILLSFVNTRSGALIDNAIMDLLHRILNCMKNFLNLSVSFSVGKICESITSIPKTYEIACGLLNEKFYNGKGSILKSTASVNTNNDLLGLSINIEKQLESSLKSNDEVSFFKTIDALFHDIITKKLNISSSQIIINDLLSIVNRLCREYSIPLSIIYTDKISPNEILENIETIDEIKGWIVDIYKILFSTLHYNINDSYSGYVKKAIFYIKLHYSENISLSYVSDKLDISSIYLSKVFKETVGIGFSEFLCDYRLAKSKELMIEGKLKLKDIISMCGFNNYAYFFNVFKKNTGITPKEFMND